MNQSQIASLPVFSTVLLGGFRNEEELLRSLLDQSGKIVSFPARDLLGDEDFKCTPYEVHSIEVSLVSITPEMFGFSHSVGYKTFCESVQKVGLLLCPRDTGPVHFLRNEKSFRFERIFYGSRPMGQNIVIFSARTWDGKNMLDSSYVEEKEGGFISSDDQFLFVRP